MSRVAFIFGSNFLYWQSLLTALAAAVGILWFCALYLSDGGETLAAAVFVPVSVVLSVVLSRLIHWYCLPTQYRGLASAMLQLTDGGYALTGCFLGCLLSALLVCAAKLEWKPLRLLDCLSASGCAAIALGRLAMYYSAADRGMIVPASMPLASAVYSGVQIEYRLPVYLVQAVLVGVLAVVVLLIAIRERREKWLPDGDITLLFGLGYSVIAIVTDSMRYDSLYFRSNGFVSVVQILSALVLVGVIVYYSVEAVRKNGLKRWYPLMWGMAAVLIGGAGFMEYYVQRHGREAVFAYTVMTVCLVEVTVITLILRRQSRRREATLFGRKPSNG